MPISHIIWPRDQIGRNNTHLGVSKGSSTSYCILHKCIARFVSGSFCSSLTDKRRPITVEHRLQKHLQNYLYRDYNMPHPKFCNMLHMQTALHCYGKSVCLSVCLSVRLSVRLYCSNRWKWGWYGQKLRAWTVPGIALTKIYHKTGSSHIKRISMSRWQTV